MAFVKKSGRFPKLKDIIGGTDSENKLEAYKRVPSPPRHTITSIFDSTQSDKAAAESSGQFLAEDRL